MQGEGLRLAKEISLEVVIAEVQGILELLAAFDFLRYQLDAPATHIGGNGGLARGIGIQEIHLDHIGEWQQADAVRGWNIVIKRNKVSCPAQALAGRDGLRIGNHILQNLNYNAVAGQQGDDVT